MLEGLTLEDIKKLDKDYLVPHDVARVLGCTPYSINCQAIIDPKALGFRVIKIKSRIKIPRLAFIAFMEGRTEGTNDR